MSLTGAHPILSCEETKVLESRLFLGDEKSEWGAMQKAGAAVASAIIEDFLEIGGFPNNGSILVVVGKGHNGGDALIAAHRILERYPQAQAEVLLVYGTSALRPLALRTWQELRNEYADRVNPITADKVSDGYTLSIDGLFGFQFRPPLDEVCTEVLSKVNAIDVTLRAAVDLPSGLEAESAFRADFTYATGVVKSPAIVCPYTGRLRYLDLGFFADDGYDDALEQVLTESMLKPLRRLRDPHGDKRSQGHLFIVAGSRDYPGAALMSVTAALRSGAGLVTAFVPESLVAAFAAQVPEAIWVGWPETPDGGLALEGRHLLQERLSRANAVVMGPGLGREPETLALAADISEMVKVPLLIDADALQPDVIRAANGPQILTPHAGEFARVAGDNGLREYAAETGATVVFKGPVTRVCAGAQVYHSLFGGPVLARGGSGDLLAGIIGAQLALTPDESLSATCRGVAWHGLAADGLARTHGSTAVRTTQLLDFLGPALKVRP